MHDQAGMEMLDRPLASVLAQLMNIVIRRTSPLVLDAPDFRKQRIRFHISSRPQHNVCGEHTLPAARGKSFSGGMNVAG
jgi:hypothetical protein